MTPSPNQVDAALISRRSIRAFLPTPVARGRGLDTCPQAAFTPFHSVIAEHLGLPAEEQLVCGMLLGFADESARVNTLRTEREPVERFARFLD